MGRIVRSRMRGKWLQGKGLRSKVSGLRRNLAMKSTCMSLRPVTYDLTPYDLTPGFFRSAISRFTRE
jgi:hypothetical protein